MHFTRERRKPWRPSGKREGRAIELDQDIQINEVEFLGDPNGFRIEEDWESPEDILVVKHFERIGHGLIALSLACIGGLAAQFFHAARRSADIPPQESASRVDAPVRGRESI